MAEERVRARELANQAIARGEPLQWFERLYRAAESDPDGIPWADMCPNPNLVEWLDRSEPGCGVSEPQHKSAVVIGCGLGDDAEELVRRGFGQVAAFDLSTTAVDWCRQRFPASKVCYSEANLLAPPATWREQYDFVLESYTLQVLPQELRGAAISQIANLVAPEGVLLVITRGRAETDDRGQMPWPLLAGDLAEFQRWGLTEVSFENYLDREDPPVRRFRVTYRKMRAASG